MKSFSLSTAYFSAGLGFGVANATYTILVLSLFLQTFPIQGLPWFWTLSGIVGFFGWRLYANTQIKTSYARLSTYVILLSIGLLFFWAFGFDYYIQSPILKQQKIFFAASFIWLLNFLWRNIFAQLNDRMHTQNGYHKIKNVGVLGNIIGEAMIYSMVAFNIFEIAWAKGIWITFGGLVLAGLSLIYLTEKNPIWKTIIINAQFIKANNGWTLMWKQKYIKYLVTFSIIVGFLFATNDFFFYQAAKVAHTFDGVTNLDKLENFLATILLAAFLGGLAVKTFLGPFIIRKYGLNISMLILPLIMSFVVLVIGVANLLDPVNLTIQAGMMVILVIVAKWLAEVLREGLTLLVYRIYLLPIDGELRNDTQHKVENQMFFVGIALGGLSLSFLNTNIPVSLGFQMLGLLLVWGGLAYFVTILNKEYKVTLQDALVKQAGSNVAVGQFVPNGKRLKDTMLSLPQEKVIAHLNVLKVINPLTYKQSLIDLLDSKNGEIRRILKEADANIDEIVQNINAKAYQITQDNEKELRLFAISLFKKIIKITGIRKKETLITDDKIWNWVNFVNDKIKILAIGGEMNRINEHENPPREDKTMEELMIKFATEIEDKIFKTAEVLLKEVQYFTLIIDETTHKIALDEAKHWCILEAIPILYVILNSKYLPVLRFADDIKNTYNFLRGAEYRLERLKYLEQLTQSKLVEERIFGALLTTYADEQSKTKLLSQLLLDEDEKVKYFATVASAYTTAPDLQNSLIEKLSSSLYGNASFSALKASGENIFPNLELAFFFAGQSETAQKRILQIYGHLGTANSIDLLLRKINLSNQFLSSLALDWLSKNSYQIDTKYQFGINRELEDICSQLTWNMSVFLDLERNNADKTLLEAMQAEMDNNFDKIFGLLALLYDPKSVELVKMNIRSGDADKADFATELLDVFMKDTTKIILKPLLTPNSLHTKIAIMQEFFPTEQMQFEDALMALVQRDYKAINIWTKSCALDILSKKENIAPDIFLANVANPEIMLSEIANATLYKKHPHLFNNKVNDFKPLKKYNAVTEVATKVQVEDLPEDIPTLKFEVAKMLQTIPELQKISGLNLAKIASLATPLQINAGENFAEYESIEDLDYWLVVKGEVVMLKEEESIKSYQGVSFFHSWHFIPEKNKRILLKTTQESILYCIQREKLNELLSLEELILQKWLGI